MPPEPTTFRRPLLTESARAAVEAVEDLMGDRVVEEEPAVAGFTLSVASTFHLAASGPVFVKAGKVGTAVGDAVTTGALLAPLVGELGPPLVGHRVVGEWSVAVYDYIAGTAVEVWDEDAVHAMARLTFRLRERLDPSPIAGTTPYAHEFAPLLGCWDALDDPDHPERQGVEHVARRTLPYGLDVQMLADLERHWFEVLGAGSALQHGDLRTDNVVREPSGRLWLVDWAHRWTAPGWSDLVRLGPDMAAHGGNDPESFLSSSAWSDAPREGINVMLAGLAGRCWRDGHLPDESGLPHLRRMQLEQGDATLHWLARRVGS